MIYTGSYDNCKSGKLVSISGDGGKQADFNGERYKKLAPKLSFWKIWHDNIGKITDEENNMFYIKEYYDQVLRYLDAVQVLQELENNAILLCYEPSWQFCHRHVVSAWLELESGIIVPEISIDTLGNITEQQRPLWIKEEYKKLIYKK
jgi:uncharacterized protein (DUF488 family)